MNLHCKKCLCSCTGDTLGAKCQTPGCGGVIERQPEFSELVDPLPERMTCGRRLDQYAPGVLVHGKLIEHQDCWQKFKANGNRVCSYCGSLHPEDMFELVKACADAPEDAPYNSVPEVEPSDKAYKIYVHQPGVRNAHEGGIKFYTQHLPRNAEGKIDISEERQDEYRRAVKATQIRFNRYLYTITPGRQSAAFTNDSVKAIPISGIQPSFVGGIFIGGLACSN